MQAEPNRPQKANGWSCNSNSDTLVDTAMTACPIHIDYDEEWLQHTPLSESNTHGERLWFNSAATDNFWAGMLDGQ